MSNSSGAPLMDDAMRLDGTTSTASYGAKSAIKLRQRNGGLFYGAGGTGAGEGIKWMLLFHGVILSND